MIPTVQGGGGQGGRWRYALTESERGHVWGVCAEVEGLFREPGRATYELFDWEPDGAEVRGWVGCRVWLVPEDKAVDPWLLEDAESPGQRRRAETLVLTGLDDYMGPPEGHRAPVRLHDGYRWLGSCREFTRVLPDEQAAPSLVLRGLSPGDRLRQALATGTRRALDLDEAWLEIRDDSGEPFTDRLLRPRIRAWRPSSRGPDLIDLELDAELDRPVPGYARPLWDRWLVGPPEAPGGWVGLDTREREAWLELVRDRGCRVQHRARPAGQPYELDGRHITDEPSLYLALGEAFNGPGGYFGACLAALADCLGGDFGYTAPATLLWRDIVPAREHLSQLLTAEGEPYDLVALVLEVLAEGGIRVTCA